MAQPFDPGKLAFTAAAQPIAEQVVSGFGGDVPFFSVSDTGSLAYRTGTSAGAGQLTWYDRTGKPAGTITELGDYNTLALSPDGTRVAFQRIDAQGNIDIWLQELATGRRTRFRRTGPATGYRYGRRIRNKSFCEACNVRYVQQGKTTRSQHALRTLDAAPDDIAMHAFTGGAPKHSAKVIGAEACHGCLKCGLCGRTFAGMRANPPQRDHYYRCIGRQFARGLYGLSGKKCPAKSLNGDYVERLVWADIEAFLRNPGDILERLRERLTLALGERQRQEKELNGLKARLDEKTAERDRMLGLFRRGRIDEATLDQHLDVIDAEAAGLQAEIEVAERALSPEDRAAQLNSAESMLAALRKRLAGPISPDLERRIIEVLVEKIVANTVERWGVQQSEVTITYRFSQPNEPAALVLPRSHKLSTRSRIPDTLETIGDHLLRRRLVLKLLQRQVAEKLGVANQASPIGRPIVRSPAWSTCLRSSGSSVTTPRLRETVGRNGWFSAGQPLALRRRRLPGVLVWMRVRLRAGNGGEREPVGNFAKRAETFVAAVVEHWPVGSARTA